MPDSQAQINPFVPDDKPNEDVHAFRTLKTRISPQQAHPPALLVENLGLILQKEPVQGLAAYPSPNTRMVRSSALFHALHATEL